MEKKEYSILINAGKKHVWQTMLNEETYREWCKAFSPDSQFIGEWKEGEKVKFVDPGMGGTLGVIDIFNPYDEILVRHIATLDKDLVELREGEMAEKWIGTTERYLFSDREGSTLLTIEMNSHPDFFTMLDEGWPNGLKKLKELSEG